MTIVEGRRWLEHRLAFLQAELERTDDAGAREAITLEIDRVSAELEQARRSWKRWLFIGGRLPRA